MTTAVLPRVRFDARQVPAGEGFERWRASIGNTYAVSLPAGLQASQFQYDIAFWQLDKVLLVDVSFGARSQKRSPRNIRADQVDHYRLSLQTAGSLRIDAGERRVVVRPGELLVTDMAREETYDSDGGANIVLFVPRDLLDAALPRPVDLHGVVPRGAAADMLSSHLRSMAGACSQVTLHEAPGLMRATVALMAASVLPSRDNVDDARPVVDRTRLRQVSRYIDAHLAQPDLSVQTIAAQVGLSRSSLYRVFEPLGGVARYVRERRLARVHALLADPAQRRHPVGRLAEDHGFASATHFSRAFREQYGYRPSEVAAGGDARTAPASALRPESSAFDRWLQVLRA